MSTAINEALLDVRKAYRLLADYQQRVNELLGFIRKEMQATYFCHSFRNRSPRGTESLENSTDAGRRFLPFNDVSVLWLRHGDQEDPILFHQKGDLLVDVWVRSDTGNGQENEPRALPEESRSELRIYFFLCNEPSDASHNWYSDVWSETYYPPLGETKICDENPGYMAYGEAINLADLTDESMVRNAIALLRARATEKLDHKI